MVFMNNFEQGACILTDLNDSFISFVLRHSEVPLVIKYTSTLGIYCQHALSKFSGGVWPGHVEMFSRVKLQSRCCQMGYWGYNNLLHS